MDELHRTDATVLLRHWLDSVESVEGPDGIEVDIVESIVAVYPGGALLKIFVDAPTLEFAEDAVGSVVEELLERSALLADWTVKDCEVQLHPELARESLEAADGPNAPPADPASRRAHHEGEAAEGGKRQADTAAEAEEMRGTLRSMAAELKAFAPASFGVLDDEDDEEGEQESDYDFGIATMWVLDELPGRYALQYDAEFTRRFLVTVLALTTRFTNGSFQQLSCVAEELALRLLLKGAHVTLELYGLLDSGVSEALSSFADGSTRTWTMSGWTTTPRTASTKTPPWHHSASRPWTSSHGSFNDGRYVHPYASEAPTKDQAPDAA